jgi:hypothetical protein
MGASKSIGDRFMHTRQHRTLSPMAKLVAYALRNKPCWNRLESDVATGMFSALGPRWEGAV